MKIINRIQIKATPQKVFYWLENPDRAMQWMTSVTRSEIIEETPNRVGTTFREYIEENERGTEMHGVVTDFVSNKRFAVHLEGNFSSAEVSFILEEKGETTQLTQYVEFHFKGIMRILGHFLGGSIRKKIIRQAQTEFARLKTLCEKDS